jgi:mannose-6-phosphate isomerase-like protein (cupin superfamily)
METFSSNKLSYIYNRSPLQITLDGKTVFVEERSWMKVHPNTPLVLDTTPNSDVFVVYGPADDAFLQTEYGAHSDIIHASAQKEPAWKYFLASGDPDFVHSDERNSHLILKLPGVVIAPRYSRHTNLAAQGWHLLYSRASKLVACATNYWWRPDDSRKDGGFHSHKIIRESYACFKGGFEMDVDGAKVWVGENQMLTVQPYEMHGFTGKFDAPTEFVVFTTPSVPREQILPK